VAACDCDFVEDSIGDAKPEPHRTLKAPPPRFP
jgi:hypothetical protein